jgi:hypothetical protein
VLNLTTRIAEENFFFQFLFTKMKRMKKINEQIFPARAKCLKCQIFGEGKECEAMEKKHRLA